MNKSLLILLCCVLTVLSTQALEPISGKDLFRNPETFSMKLDPTGRYIASYNQGEDGNFFELIDPKSQQSYVLLTIPFHEKFRLLEYKWVDSKTIYVALNEKVGFLHLDFSGDTPKGKYIGSKAKGYIVSTLPEQDDTVIFAKNIGKYKNKYKLVYATTKQLEQDKVDESYPLNVELYGAAFYTYDDVNQTFISYKVDGDKVSFWLRKPDTQDWEFFWAVDKKVNFTPIGLLSEGTLAVLTDKDENLVSLREFDIKTQTLGKVLFQHSMYDLTGAELEPMGQGIKSVSYIQHGVPTKHYFSNDKQKEDRNLKHTFNQQQLTIVDSSLDNNKHVILVFNSDNPGEYYLYDRQKNKAQFIKEKSPHLDKYELTKSQVFSVNVEDDVTIEAILSMPTSDHNGVLLVNPHGGPIGVRDYATYDPKLQYFTSRGYAVLNVNFRGSSGFGKQFLESGKAQFGQLIEQDISKAVADVKKQHKFTHTCSIGTSYGGYSAVMLAIKHPKEYQCVVAMYGVYDLPLLFNASNFERKDENRQRIEEVVGELDDTLKAVSPFYIAEKLHAPILLVAGDDDQIAYLEHTNRMKYRLGQLSKDFETLIYNDVGHGHSRWKGDKHQYAYVDDFIKRKLNLPKVNDEKALAALAHDAVVLADANNFSTWFSQDAIKALSFYREAASLGESRAMFNIGSFYHQGKVVDKDIAEAVVWYKKSSSAGYAEASFRLGELYRKSEHITENLAYAYEMFLLASKQKKNYDGAEFAVSRAKCLEEGTISNIDECLNHLFYLERSDKNISTMKKKNKDTYYEWRDVLAEVLWLNTFDTSDEAKLNALVKSELNVDLLRVDVQEVAFGLYEQKSRYSTDKVHSEETRIVPMIKNTEFGVTLLFDIERNIGEEDKKRAMVKYRWILPKSIEDKEENSARIIQLEKEQKFRFTLSEAHELVVGEWVLEVYSLNDTLLYSKTFVTEETHS